jgi:diaminohydroxyphosphoribosylaminopyrimidine deaminase/5-amino-6-(5-phosphoribosylamino)uracil reductase
MTDDDFLLRAIALAQNGRGHVEPNPLVGCVIVKNGRIIGEGFHKTFGGPHAEPVALAACTELPAGATVYVTLEPCCHLDKKTPPCVPRLIAAGIGRLVYGTADPNPRVGGQGLAQLRAAGIAVDGPVQEPAARQLLAPFIRRMQSPPMPYVTLKWAQTTDGKIAGTGGARLQISNAASTHAVQKLRSRCDAILVGVNTVRVDNPLLLPRDVPTLRPLVRIIPDRGLRTLPISQLIQSASKSPVVIFYDPARATPAADHPLAVPGVMFLSANSLADVLTQLGHLQPAGPPITHLLVEPGPTLARAFFDANLVDRLWTIQSPRILGDPTAPAAAAIPGDFVPTGQRNLDGDILTESLNPHSTAFFANTPSADWLLMKSS